MNEQLIQQLLARGDALLARLEAVLPHAPLAPDWGASVAFRYRKRGASGVLEPVRHVARINLADLKEVDGQKERLVRNTEQFVAGRPANNVLLTGARGTGKSSLIKACLNAFAPQGLRLIEVDKTDLVDLPDLVDLVAARPERFIVFCDDLSFDEGEPGYKELKSILDGTVSQSSRQRADLRHQQPPPPAARVHEGKPHVQTHRGRRGAPRRGGGGKDLAERTFRPVGEFLPVQPGRIPGHRGTVAPRLRCSPRRQIDRHAPALASCGRSNAARARGAWRSSSRKT